MELLAFKGLERFDFLSLKVSSQVDLQLDQQNLQRHDRPVCSQVRKRDSVDDLAVALDKLLNFLVYLVAWLWDINLALGFLRHWVCVSLVSITEQRLLLLFLGRLQTCLWPLTSMVLHESSQVLGKLRLTNRITKSEQNLVEQLNLFLDCLVTPKPAQMESFHEHERPDLAIRFLFQNVMLHNVFFEMRMLEDLVLDFGEEEQKQESHID